MPASRYDVVVIGTGPGGEGAAMKAAKSGLSVAVVERFRKVGGGCTHWATIPSKALRQVLLKLADFRSHPLFQKAALDLRIGLPELLKTADSVIGQQVRMRRSFYDRNRVPIHQGRARFVDARTIEVLDPDGGSRRLSAKHFVVATGSRPYRPPELDFSHPRVLDSDKVLGLRETPRSLTIYGAGVVGCEYASIFRTLEIKVNLVNTRTRLLDFLDDEISEALGYHLRDRGVVIRHREECERVEAKDDEVILHLKSGKRLKTDYLLWCNGRTGNTDELGVENLGAKIDQRGNFLVDANYRTSVRNVYAVGDVVGFPALASAAYDQGRFAATHIAEGRCRYRLAHQIPTGIYTNPEISSLGATERELTEKKIPYEVGHAQFRSLARAQITGQTVGMLKLLFHRDTLALLGIHCFGYQAAEIVHIGQAIMAQKGKANSLLYFVNTTFNYPTMAEAYRVAALNGLNRL